MALIEIQHVIADMYNVDPDWTDAIVEGMLVKLNANGYVEACDTAGELVLGVAGDTQANTGGAETGSSNTPYADELVINSNGAKRWTQNRVSDFFDETLASGKLTVYQSGGKFATDIYEDTVDSAVPGNLLYTSDNGKLTTASAGDENIVGICTAAVAEWDSGVPGIDTAKGSITLGDYVEFKLTV